ncbi:MAG: prolipoprotein diacylglyceryl transferase [Bacteroidales bacterium]|nr:prolipoprotein diacylglyceryl transferase [Bacteroidales bacterium]
MLLLYIKWDIGPGIFSIGSFTLRWYSLLLVTGFLCAYFILSRMFEKENVGQQAFNKFALYLFLGTVIGLRLGHCLFYDPLYYLSHPLEILMVWKGGLASHGAALGILISMGLYARKYKKNFFWLLDRIVIIVCLAGAMVRVGNLMNSEIIGMPTAKKTGFLFVNGFDRYLTKQSPEIFLDTKISKLNSDTTINGIVYTKMQLSVWFNNRTDSAAIADCMVNRLPVLIGSKPKLSENVLMLPGTSLSLEKERRKMRASVVVYAIPRHPAQLYEAAFYLFLFFVFYGLYRKLQGTTKNGLFFGSFTILLFSFRFIIEFLKENQVDAEKNMFFNIGQLLSIPFIIAGFVILFMALKQKSPAVANNK